jgi:formate hydrogenlyase transcriptional activator
MVQSADFFQEAATRLLSGKPITTAWQDCLVYLRRTIPADFLSLHLFSAGLSVMETVVDATPEKSEPVSVKSTLSPKARKIMQAAIKKLDGKPDYKIISDLSKLEESRQIGKDLDTPDSPSLVLHLFEGSRYLGCAVLTSSPGQEYTRAHAKSFLSIHAPLAAGAAIFHRNLELERVRELLSDRTMLLNQELLTVAKNEIVGGEFGLKGVMELAGKVAEMNTPVLLLGETGTGKEVIAGAIHLFSSRKSGPFIKVNCGAITPSLLESELFGHEKGAFTGADKFRHGYFERANGGTIFLDEVAELSPEAQVRLLRVLQEKEIERVGGDGPIKLDLRVLAATHRDMDALVHKGAFREDLFFRLNVFPIHIPPLRERIEDIPALAYHFFHKKSKEMALPDLPAIVPGAVESLMAYDWPGNVRELENVIERQIIICQGEPISFDFKTGNTPIPNGQSGSQGDTQDDMSLDLMIKRHIIKVMHMAGGKIEGNSGAAAILGMHPRTLQSRMKKLGIPFGRSALKLYSQTGLN